MLFVIIYEICLYIKEIKFYLLKEEYIIIIYIW